MEPITLLSLGGWTTENTLFYTVEGMGSKGKVNPYRSCPITITFKNAVMLKSYSTRPENTSLFDD